MPLDIEFKGTKKEKEFIRKIIYPFEEPMAMRNRFLDVLIFGVEEYEAMGKEKTFLGNVPVTVEPYKKGKKYFSIENIHNLKKDLHNKMILLLKPLNRELSFNYYLCKSQVHKADKKSILFSYGLRESHPDDGIMVIKMFYQPEAQAESAR